MQAAPPPAHAVVRSRSPAVVEFILALHPVGSYLCWCPDQQPESIEIVVRDRAPVFIGQFHDSAQFQRIPLCSTVEADLRAAGYTSAVCALPPPRVPARITPNSSATPTTEKFASDAPSCAADLRLLPSDLWSSIVARLDTKSMLRFRLVSKVRSFAVLPTGFGGCAVLSCAAAMPRPDADSSGLAAPSVARLCL